MKFFRIALIASVTAMTGSVFAATDGDLGATSTGTSIINISKDNAVQITNVDDIDLGTQGNLTATATQSDDVCVFSSTGGYAITLTSANGSFDLKSGATTTDIPYSIDWTAGTTTTASYGTTMTGWVGDSLPTLHSQYRSLPLISMQLIRVVTLIL